MMKPGLVPMESSIYTHPHYPLATPYSPRTYSLNAGTGITRQGFTGLTDAVSERVGPPCTACLAIFLRVIFRVLTHDLGRSTRKPAS